MKELTGFTTTNGLPIYSFEHIKQHRAQFRKTHNDYIAQQGGQENALKVNADIIFSGGNRGGGKANTYSTKIITPNGDTTMGQLKVGDLVCTPYDGIQQVTNIFEQGEQNFYHIYFDDNTFVSVMDNHRFWARLTPSGDFREYSAREIIDRYRIDSPYPNSLRKNIDTYAEIPLTAEIDFAAVPADSPAAVPAAFPAGSAAVPAASPAGETTDTALSSIASADRANGGYPAGSPAGKSPLQLPIHPYVLGAIMSSGTTHFSHKGAVVDFSMAAKQRVLNLGYKWRYRMKQNLIVGYREQDRRAITASRMPRPSRMPQQYKLASIQSRWEFLRGVLDMKGGIYKAHPYLCLPNKQFVEDIAWLARSLGCWAKVFQVADGSEKDGYWRVNIIAPDDRECFHRETYQKKMGINGNKPTSCHDRLMLTKHITHIKKIKKKQKCRCITVSGNDHLYLSDAFTVNHNTVTLLMDAMYDIDHPHFSAIIFRKEKDDLRNIVRESRILYGSKGHYNKSKDDMTWYFSAGGELKLTYFEMAVEEFTDKYRGQQFAYIGVDELTQLDYEMFKTLVQCNRNGFGIRNRMVGTCNPDPLTWVRPFIDWWIGPDGYPIPERDGKIRYCFMYGDTSEQVIWGDTRTEVYLKAKDKIDAIRSEKDVLPPEEMYVKSVTFVRAELDDNRALLDASPEYKANLAQQSDEKIERDLKGNWNYMATGDDMVKMIHLQRCFQNAQMLGDKVRRATCDVAFEGGDSLVMWLWIGYHVADIFVCKKDSQDTVNLIRAKLDEWRVLEENFVYDLNGVGQVLKGFFRRAKPFNNRQAVDDKFKGMYDNIKSQTFYMFANIIKEARISFDEEVLARKFSGKGFDGRPLRDILQQERKCLRKDESKADQGWCIIKKEEMKKLCKHSPDFFEALAMRSYFDIKTSVSINAHSWLKHRHPNIRIRHLS